jgi:hypothetical protein
MLASCWYRDLDLNVAPSLPRLLRPDLFVGKRGSFQGSNVRQRLRAVPSNARRW